MLIQLWNMQIYSFVTIFLPIWNIHSQQIHLIFCYRFYNRYLYSTFSKFIKFLVINLIKDACILTSALFYWCSIKSVFVAMQGDVDAIHLLLKYGADMSAFNRFGQTPLHLACRSGSIGKQTRIMFYIEWLKWKNNVNISL